MLLRPVFKSTSVELQWLGIFWLMLFQLSHRSAASGALKLVMGCIFLLEEGGEKEFQAYPVKTFPFRVHCPIVQDWENFGAKSLKISEARQKNSDRLIRF